MSEKDFDKKHLRIAVQQFCEQYCDRLSLLEVELMILAIRSGDMIAALEEFDVTIRRIREAAKLLDEKCKEE